MQKNPTFLVTVDEDFQLPIRLEEASGLDFIKVAENHYHVLFNNRSYEVKVDSAEFFAKRISFLINGSIYSVQLHNELDQLISNLGLAGVGTHQMSELRSPMPGLVLDVLVKPGDAVQEGNSLLILEAMKMENVLKAQGTGIVREIHVNPRDVVDKNVLLISFE